MSGKPIMTLTLTTCLLFLFPLLISAHPTSRATTVTSTSKAGLAGGGDMAQFQKTGKVSWYYTWGLSSGEDTDLEFVPMLWGQKDVAGWTDPNNGINATIAARKPTAILGMNEPQEKGQSNLTPQQGADMWKTYLEPLRAQGIRLGSPAPSSAPSGKTWIQDFLTACAGGCTVDFIALHWYDVNATHFINYLNDFHSTFNLPIWVTEWACQNFNNGPQCTAPDIALLLNQTQAFMDSQDWVERYAWYGTMRVGDLNINSLDAMLTNDGKLNDLGEQYIGAEAPKTSGASPIGTGTGGARPTGSGGGGLPGLPGNADSYSSSWLKTCFALVAVTLFQLF